MSTHLKYQKLPWGGYVVRNVYVWERVVAEHFFDSPPPTDTPRSYPCVVWFKDQELCQASLPKTLDAGMRRLGELAEENWRLYRSEPKPTDEQLNRDRGIAFELASICKMQRWAGVEMRKRYEKFLTKERGLNGMFYIELNVDAIEWDRRPPNVDANGCIRVWMRELRDVFPTHQGLSMWFGRGIATYMHGNRPVASWEAIKCVGSLRPGGTTAKFYPELQYARPPLLSVMQDICRMLKDVDLEFDE